MKDNAVVIDRQSYNLRGPMEMHLPEDYVVYAMVGTIYVVSGDKMQDSFNNNVADKEKKVI